MIVTFYVPLKGGSTIWIAFLFKKLTLFNINIKTLQSQFFASRS